MGKRGPKRTPLSMLESRGSRLPEREGRVELAHADGECDCPDWVGEFGRELWEEYYPRLRDVLGLMKPAYRLDLALLCEAYNDMRCAMVEIDREGPTSVSEKGGQYQHPAVGRKNKAIARMLKIGPRFGLNPADATNVRPIGEGGESRDDPFDVLTKGSDN